MDHRTSVVCSCDSATDCYRKVCILLCVNICYGDTVPLEGGGVDHWTGVVCSCVSVTDCFRNVRVLLMYMYVQLYKVYQEGISRNCM